MQPCWEHKNMIGPCNGYMDNAFVEKLPLKSEGEILKLTFARGVNFPASKPPLVMHPFTH